MEPLILKTLLILVVAILFISIGPAFAILEQKRARQNCETGDSDLAPGTDVLKPALVQDQGRNGNGNRPKDTERIDETPRQEADELRDVARVSK